MNLWVVGYQIRNSTTGTEWNFCGVFEDEETAKQQCISEHYFIAPAVMNRVAPNEQHWTGMRHPLREATA